MAARLQESRVDDSSEVRSEACLGDGLRRSYIESGYVLVADLVDEADRAEISRELRRINRGDYSRSPTPGVIWRDEIEPGRLARG